MRYADFYECDICNGNEVGVSLFVQGCPFHCKGCFNQETWDFNGGKEWNEKTEERFLDLVGREYIHRVSFLGGSPLCDENVDSVCNLIFNIKEKYPNKEIWVYTGMIWEDIWAEESELPFALSDVRKQIMRHIDVLVDGPFEYDKRDLSLAFRGSSNQRIIDVQASLKNGNVVLYELNN